MGAPVRPQYPTHKGCRPRARGELGGEEIAVTTGLHRGVRRQGNPFLRVHQRGQGLIIALLQRGENLSGTVGQAGGAGVGRRGLVEGRSTLYLNSVQRGNCGILRCGGTDRVRLAEEIPLPNRVPSASPPKRAIRANSTAFFIRYTPFLSGEIHNSLF